MAAEGMTIQGARISAAVILAYLYRDNSVPAR